MAFNPFNWFRKNQRVIFAVLTIVIMFLFIGSFGRGDLVDQATRYFGGGRASGAVVTTMYGKKVREGDLLKLATNRRLASNFLFATAWDAHAKVCADLLKGQLQSTAPDNPLSGLREIVQSAQQRTGIGLLTSRVPANFLRIQIEQELNRLEEIASRDKVKDDPERLELVRRVATVLGFQFWLTGPTQIREAFNYAQSTMMGGRNRAFPATLYFGGSDQVEEMLDFALWRQQADRLGVQLSDRDLAREVNAEAAGLEVVDPAVAFESNRSVTSFMANQPGVAQATTRDLLEGLREEFRVVMTQAALLGEEPGARAYRLALGATSSPALATPDEFLNYYREVRTTLRVKLLKVPVSAFFDKVKGEPTETELHTRFDRYKNQEPTPAGREPGFKEPRRVQVEYVYASPSDSYYRDLGKAKLFAWAAGTVGAVSTAPIEAAAAVLLDPLREEYDREVRSGDFDWFYNPRDSLSMYEEKLKKLHYTSVMRPRVIASLVAGQATGSTLGALSAVYAGGTVEEVRAGVKFTLTQLLANVNPQTLFANASLIAAALPEPPSFRLMEPQILATVQERSAEDELRKNLKKVTDELQKLKGRAKEAKEFLTKSAKEYHLKHLAMPEPMTEDAIVSALKHNQDIGLAPLREALMKAAREERVDQFVKTLFNRVGTLDPMQFANREPRKEEFAFWRSQDLPSRSRDYGQVRREIEAAWRLEQARRLASREAERIEAEINKAKVNAADAVRMLNEQKLGDVFELENVAQLVPPRETLAARRTEYNPYQVPEDKQALFEYPPPDLAKRLLTLKRSGEATVVADLPGKNFYVAVLLDRNEPTLADFKSVYARTPKEDTLYSLFVTQRRTDYRRSVMEQLRRDAAGPDGVDKDGRWKIPDSVRRDHSARDEDVQ